MVRINIHDATRIQIQDTVFSGGHAWKSITIRAGNEVTEVSVFSKCVDNLEIRGLVPAVINFGPNHYAVCVGRATFYYSYNTCVAYSNDCFSARIEAESRTTARHLRKMGVMDFPVLDKQQFSNLLF